MTNGITSLDALDNLVTGIAFIPIKQTKELRLKEGTSLEHGLGSLVCCSPQGHKESDRTEQLNKKILCISHGQSGELKSL